MKEFAYFLFFTDTHLLLVLLTTSSSGCSQMATSSRTFQATMLSSTLWLLTLTACWCQEVLRSAYAVAFSVLHSVLTWIYRWFQYCIRNTSRLVIHHTHCVFSVADNGTIHMWDWRTGYNFQRIHAAVQPGSLDSESGIFACLFDHSESRLITAEADKTIKVYKEDDTAVSFTIKSKV